MDSAAAFGEETTEEDILELLERIDDYESFTQEEKLLLYKYLNLGYDMNEAFATEGKVNAEYYNAFEALPDSAKAEIKILQMDKAEKTYATLSDDEKAVFYDYLEITEDEKAVMDTAFVQLAAQGKALFESKY